MVPPRSRVRRRLPPLKHYGPTGQFWTWLLREDKEEEKPELRHSLNTLIRILDLLEPRDLLALRCTCHSYAEAVDEFISEKWDVDELLLKFVKDPHKFRYTMGHCEGIISGTLAMQFFAGLPWDDKMEVLIQDGYQERAVQFGHYLRERENYVPVNTSYTSSGGAIISTTPYYKIEKGANRSVTIVIVATYNPPWDAVLVTARTTAECNMITWNNAYCLFPDLTLTSKIAFRMDPHNGSKGRASINYKDRTSKLIWHLEELTEAKKIEGKNTAMIHHPRRLGDNLTWTISTQKATDDIGLPPNYQLAYSTFLVQLPNKEAQRHDQVGFQIKRRAFQSCIFKNTYSCAPEDGKPDDGNPLIDDFWTQNHAKFEAMSAQQFHELRVTPSNPDALFLNALAVRRVPCPVPGWTFHDEKIPGWVAAWEEEKRGEKRFDEEIGEAFEHVPHRHFTTFFTRGTTYMKLGEGRITMWK